MNYERTIRLHLIELAKKYPIITIIGPRQSGKTTLTKMAFPQKAYVTFEDHDVRALAEKDPRRLLNKYPDGAILDEIQRVPIILSYLQTLVDNDERKGLFILTGSHQFELRQELSQSLAGRTALLTLLPFSLQELTNANFNLNLDEQLLTGFYPRIYKDSLLPTEAYRNYIQTYLERDLRQLINVKDLSNFQRFMKLCAGRVGQILNKNSLSNDLGVSNITIDNWISILEASHIIIRLQPYFENFGKRIIKSPKLYFTDPGLAAYLLDIENVTQMSRDPLRGNLVENLVLLELIKYRYNKGLDHHLYFYRDQHKNEVDFIFKYGHILIPIEVKSAETISFDFFKGLKFFKKLIENRFEKGFLIYSGENMQKFEDFSIINYRNIQSIFNNDG